MDDISVIAPITILKQIATFIQQRYEVIGLSLNISECLIIGHEPIDFFINDVNVPFINYDQSGFRFLGCYHGNIEEVKGQLSTLLTQFGNELESIENLNIEKHWKFFPKNLSFCKVYSYFEINITTNFFGVLSNF
ncbi:hypothetical protein P9112_006528 [Eukaryota sp. TZLM1-RC]